MLGKLGNSIFGIMFYALGAITVNVFFNVPERTFFFSPTIELSLIAAGVFFLSAFFYGRYGSVTLLFAGAFIGTHFRSEPLMSGLALIPCVIAMAGGTSLGNAAYLDLKGKKNLFEMLESCATYLLFALILSAAIGQLAPGIKLPAIPNPFSY